MTHALLDLFWIVLLLALSIGLVVPAVCAALTYLARK